MNRLRGPIRELLEDTASDERVARVERAVAARRLGRTRSRSIFRPAAIAAIALAGAGAAFALISTQLSAEKVPAPQSARALVAAPVVEPDEKIEPVEKIETVGKVEPVEKIETVEKILVEPEKRPPARAPKLETVDDLFRDADRARSAGDHSAALTALAKIFTAHSSDPRAGLAAFTAARIEQDTLREAAHAAAHIELALALGLTDDLREPARARLMDAYLDTQNPAAAQRAAINYLASHPTGERAGDARRIAGVGAD